MTFNPIQIHALKRLLKASLRFLDPPPGLSVWRWGEERRRLGKNVSAKPGRYRVSEAPFQREPQEAFKDPDVQTTVLYWAKRLGKTEMINNLHGATIEQWPCNILVCYPTLDSSKKWSKQFFDPMKDSTPALRVRVGKAKSRDSSNTILAKSYPGGTISAIGSNSPSGFRQVQAPVVTCDEIDAMQDGPEGDPVTLAFGRAENYPDSVQVVASTATRVYAKPAEGDEVINTGSRIHNWWLKSDQRKWFVPCPKCGVFQVLKWSQMKWPQAEPGPNARDNLAGRHEQAWYECENSQCNARWSDQDRLCAVLRGEWRPTAPFRGVRGYWLNGLNTTFPPKKGYRTKLHQFVAEFYDAYTSGEAARIAWKNTFLCEPHEEAAERIQASPLLERREAYSPETLPEGVIILGAAVDVQGDRLEVEVVGMGMEEETWGVEYFRLFGNPEQREVWKDLAERLAKKYLRKDGVEMNISCSAIDLGHKPKEVRRFIKSCGLPRVYGVHGLGPNAKQVNLVTAKFNKLYRQWSYAINTSQAKDTIFARLKLKDAGGRYLHFPIEQGYTAEYFNGLTAEECRVRYSHGFPERYYEKIRERNEPLDIRVYFLAAMDILKPNLKAIASTQKPSQGGDQGGSKSSKKPMEYELKQTPAPKQAKPAPNAPAKKRKRITMGGGMGGFKL